jgi:hypothetical protein
MERLGAFLRRHRVALVVATVLAAGYVWWLPSAFFPIREMPAGSYANFSLYRIERTSDGFTASANHGGFRDVRHTVRADASTVFKVQGEEADIDAFLERELSARPPLWAMEVGEGGRIVEMREIPLEEAGE